MESQQINSDTDTQKSEAEESIIAASPETKSNDGLDADPDNTSEEEGFVSASEGQEVMVGWKSPLSIISSEEDAYTGHSLDGENILGLVAGLASNADIGTPPPSLDNGSEDIESIEPDSDVMMVTACSISDSELSEVEEEKIGKEENKNFMDNKMIEQAEESSPPAPSSGLEAATACLLRTARSQNDMELIEPDTDILMLTVCNASCELPEIQDDENLDAQSDDNENDNNKAQQSNRSLGVDDTSFAGAMRLLKVNNPPATDVGEDAAQAEVAGSPDEEVVEVATRSNRYDDEKKGSDFDVDCKGNVIEDKEGRSILAHKNLRNYGKPSLISLKKSPTKTVKVENALGYSVMEKILKNARFFTIKSYNHENVNMAKKENIWSTRLSICDRLRKALETTDNVILFFSVNESHKFAGFARVVRCIDSSNRLSINWVGVHQGQFAPDMFQLDWISKCELDFDRTNLLRNSWNQDKLVKIARDGQEIEPTTGVQLALLFKIDKSTDWKKIAKHLEESASARSRDGCDPDSYCLKPTSPLPYGGAEFEAGNYSTFGDSLRMPRGHSTSTPRVDYYQSRGRKRAHDEAESKERSPKLKPLKRSREHVNRGPGPFSWEDVCDWCAQHVWRFVPPPPPMPFPPPAPFDHFPPPPMPAPLHPICCPAFRLPPVWPSNFFHYGDYGGGQPHPLFPHIPY